LLPIFLFYKGAQGVTPAERLLTAYHGPWHGDVTRIFAEESD